MLGVFVLVAAGAGLLSRLDAAQWHVAAPALAIVVISALFLATLNGRDGVLPIFEVGTMTVVATTAYALIPLLAFLLSGMTWTVLSDSRLLTYHPTAQQVGAFFWRHVVYLASFAAVYLVMRGRAVAMERTIDGPDTSTQAAIFGLLGLIVVYFWLLQVGAGVSYNLSYEDVRQGTGLQTQLPYLVQQITNNVASMRLVLKYAAALLLLQRWDSRLWRAVLLVWLLGEVMLTVGRMGSRSETVLFLLGVGLLRHRIVRPWRMSGALAGGILMLGGMVAYGAVRDTGLGLGALQQAFSVSEVSAWSTVNEFQVLFGTPYDLFMRKAAGVLPAAPWQVYAGDLLLPIPSQLLPFPKIDPAEWYLGVADLRGTGFGAMFGVISQAIIGFDWAELVARGALLGVVFAALHRWYVPRQRAFWPTLTYLFVCIWSYYTFRASTFFMFTFFLFQFVPVFIVVSFMRTVLRATLSVRSPE